MVRSSLKTPPLRLTTQQDASAASDERLIEGLQRREPVLANELYRRLLRAVDAALYRVLGRRDSEHEDLVQTAIERIVSGLFRGKFSRDSSLSTWASGVACNVALRAVRRRKLERRLFDRSPMQAASLARTVSANPEAQVIACRTLQSVHTHLACMSSKLSETLLLHDVLGYELKETANLAGISLSAARSRLVRGRRDLLRRLRHETGLLLTGPG
jgi:RNA polymerase sigma-70 factor (ECF subfamily)